jgi:hypothetical protein
MKKRGNFYAVAHGWGGSIVSRSYSMTWTSQANFKLHTHLHQPSGIQKFTTAHRRKTTLHSKAKAILHVTTPHIKPFQPPGLPKYVWRQLMTLEISAPNAHSGWHNLPEPTMTAYTLGWVKIHIFTNAPETEAPPIDESIQLFSLTFTLAIEDVKCHYESCKKALHLVSMSKFFAFPQDPSRFLH